MSSSHVIGSYIFEPFGIKTLEPWQPSDHLDFQDNAKGLVEPSRDQMAGLFIDQKISIAIQGVNVASLLGTAPVDGDAEEFVDAYDSFAFFTCLYYYSNYRKIIKILF